MTKKFSYFTKNPTEKQIVDILSDIKHRVFPRSFERLSGICDQKNLVGVEIGVFCGSHAQSLIENSNMSKLYLIDAYDLYEDYNEGKQVYGISQLDLKNAEIQARKLLDPYKSKIVWLKGYSKDMVSHIQEPLDFVYIDGNHDQEYVWEDITNYWPLVKSNGILGGHDYYNGFRPSHNGVVTSASRFAVENNLQLHVELPDWWIKKP